MPRSRASRVPTQHARLTSPGPVRQLLRLILVAVAVFAVSAIGVTAYAANDLTSSFTADAVALSGQEEEPPDIGELDDAGINILVAGLDACEKEYEKYFGEGRCPEGSEYDPETRDGVLNDVNMLIHVSEEPRRLTVVSLPRDLMTEQPACTDPQGDVSEYSSRASLNEAYYRGDLGCIADTVASVTGQKIDYAATITWGGVIEITDAIGGVAVCVGGEGIHDEHTGLDLDPGDHPLVGVQALQFLRTRYGVGGSDLNRISNQQVYLSALVKKMMSEEVLTDPATVLRLAKTTLENVNPSTSLTDPLTLAKIAMAVKDIPLEDFVFVQYPVVDDPYDSNKVAPNTEVATRLFLAINDNVQITLGDNVGQGAVLQDDGDDDASAATPTPSATAGSETSAPVETATEGDLGDALSGTNGLQTTCSNGAGQ